MTRLLLAALLTLAALPARAATAEDFYRGRQMTMWLSADAGGGYASYALAFAPHFAAHIPGRPHIVVQYMPGAGGLRAMNFLYTNAEKDGSVIGLVHSSVPFAPLYGLAAARYDPRRINWIGSINATNGICVAWHESGVRTWDDLFSKEYFVGGTGAGSQMETLPLILNKLFGTNIKIISGYQGGNDVYVAMERGEVDGRCGGLVSSISSTRPDWFPEGKVYVPVQIAMERDPMFPDAPAIGELAKDELTRQVVRLILAPMDMDRPVLAPPGVPAERVSALRAAFHAAMNDPAFLADAARMKLEIKEVDGAAIERIFAAAYAMPPEVIRTANEAMNLTGGTGGGN